MGDVIPLFEEMKPHLAQAKTLAEALSEDEMTNRIDILEKGGAEGLFNFIQNRPSTAFWKF